MTRFCVCSLDGMWIFFMSTEYRNTLRLLIDTYLLVSRYLPQLGRDYHTTVPRRLPGVPPGGETAVGAGDVVGAVLEVSSL